MSQDLLVAGHSNSFEFSIIPKWCQQFSLLPIFSVIFCHLALHGVADLLVNIFQPTGSLVRSNFKPDSLAPATRRGSGSVQQILLQLCGQDFGEKHLGSTGPWDGLGWPGMAWDVEISCIFLHGPKLSEFTLQKHEQVYSVHFVWTWIPTLKRSQWCSGHVELILLIPSSETREQLTRFCHLQCLD